MAAPQPDRVEARMGAFAKWMIAGTAIFLLVMAIAMLALSPLVGGIIFLVALGVGFVAWYFGFRDQRPALVVDAAGIASPVNGWGPIPWAEVRGVTAQVTGGGRSVRQLWLGIDVERPERFGFKTSRLSQFNAKAFGLAPVSVSLSYLSISEEQLLKAVERHSRIEYR